MNQVYWGGCPVITCQFLTGKSTPYAYGHPTVSRSRTELLLFLTLRFFSYILESLFMSASPPPPNYCCFLWISFFAPLFLSSFSVTHNVNVYPLDVVPIVTVLVTQSCPTLCKTHRCSPPISPVHGILQARILEWVVNSFSRSLPKPGIKPSSPALQADSLPSEL